MCGISGIVRFDNQLVDKSALHLMNQEMKHRGPDDSGVYITDKIGLGFVRLSILDLSEAGHQPMSSVDGRYTLVFNGEIYNYVELREELISKGHVFVSNTDSEVLLHSYMEWGEESLHKFNGMFAFAILDKKDGSLFAARDRYGIKPFYIYQDENQFVFCSEIKAILALKLFKPTINDKEVFSYFNFNRTDFGTSTFFNEINKLGHGEKLKIFEGRVTQTRWYTIGDYNHLLIDNPEKFKDNFIKSVKLRLRSDVPYGVCLSGGLDSGSIVRTVVDSLGDKNINSFSSVFKINHRANESVYIDELTKDMNNVHKVHTDENSLLADLDDLIQTHPEPFTTPAIYAQYKVMQLARNAGVTVLLDGQGADEYLCGYHYFYGFYYKELFKNFKLFTLVREIFYEYYRTRKYYGFKTFGYFLLPKWLKTKTSTGRNSLVVQSFYKEQIADSTIINSLHESKDLSEAIRNHFEYKLEHLLKWEDVNSMRFSLESRVPFLDYHLVEGLYHANSKHKINKGWTKSILRESMKEMLPRNITYRKDKTGFATPSEIWMKSNEMMEVLKGQLAANSDCLKRYVDLKRLNELIEIHQKGKSDYSGDLWRVLNFMLWHKKYIG